MNPEIIGMIAGVFTTFAAIPQIIKIYKIKEARDISLIMYIFLVIGVILWLIYGLQINSVALIAWNIIALLLNSFILIQKIYYDSKLKNKDYL
jgi:MtN3 and saliva related transmembrane protein